MNATPSSPEQVSWAPPADLAALQTRAWIVGGAAMVASIAGAFVDSGQFFASYLVAWLLWTGVALGSFGVLMIHHLSGGAWGIPIRRILEAASRTLPLLGIAFVPILLNLGAVYSWARPEAADDPLILQKAAYLNPTAFTVRTVFYFALWTAIAFALTRLSHRFEQTGDPEIAKRMRVVAAPGLLLYALTGTFASVDWLMSLDPHWYSSLFGVYILGGNAVAAFAVMIPVALFLARREPMSRVFKPVHFHDYGKLLLAFVMLWAYFAFSQLLIIWSGNLAEEVVWYLERVEGGWKYVSIALALFHFVLPFLLLLSRDLKRSASRLAWVALLLLVMCWVDIYWQAAPTFHHHGLAFHWLDATTAIGLGGIWFALFVGQLRRRSLMPIPNFMIDEDASHD